MSSRLAAFLGWRVFGAGIAAMSVVNLVIGSFDPTQPVPKSFPYRTELGYLAAVFMLAAGLALEWRPFTSRAAGALTVYYVLVVLLLMNGWVLIHHYNEYVAYLGIAEDLALAAACILVYAASAELRDDQAAGMARTGRCAFGLCAIVFGGAHFFYPQFTIPLVPKWLPPSQGFWAYATGVFHIAGGLGILLGVAARWAAILLTIMFGFFTPLVHVPMLLSDPSKHFYWTENALNLALVGAAWVVADSLSRAKRPIDSKE